MITLKIQAYLLKADNNINNHKLWFFKVNKNRRELT